MTDAVCLDDCNDICLIAQVSGDYRRYCEPDIRLRVALTKCEACLESNGVASNSGLRNSIQQLRSYCQPQWDPSELPSYRYPVSPTRSPITNTAAPTLSLNTIASKGWVTLPRSSFTGDSSSSSSSYSNTAPINTNNDFNYNYSRDSIPISNRTWIAAETAGPIIAVLLAAIATFLYIGWKRKRKAKANDDPESIDTMAQLHGDSLDPSKLLNSNSRPPCQQADSANNDDIGPPYELPANEPPAVELMSNSVSSR